MTPIPAIGAARGIFEIFVPGLFLLLNLSFVVNAAVPEDDPIRRAIGSIVGVPLVALFISIPFGYLLGVILRIVRVEAADAMSAWTIKMRKRKKKLDEEDRLYYLDSFPFLKWLESRSSKAYPKEAKQFYDDEWTNRPAGKHGRGFFNFCKQMLVSEDSAAFVEVAAAEAFSRYIASIVYALLFSIVLLTGLGVYKFFAEGSFSAAFLAFVGVYGLCLFFIVPNYRLVRLKEVEIVFASTFKNRSRIFKSRD